MSRLSLDYQKILCCQHVLCSFSISSDSVGLPRPVDAVDKLCRHEVAQILHTVRCSVYVVVATFSVVTEAVGVFHTQVQARVSGYEHRLADEWSADLKVLEPVVDVIVGVEGAD